MENIKDKYQSWFLIAYTLALIALLSGCIRLTGSAGVWKQGADDPAPSSAEAGFDTNQIVPQKNKANIT
jgi:hypothetical protein